MKYNYVESNDPVLYKIAEPIPEDRLTSPETQAIIKALFDIAYPEQGDKSKPVLVGLAAPQIGIAKRVILVDVGADGHANTSDLQAFINPEVVSASGEMIEYREGCYSTSKICGIVQRPSSVRIKAYTATGELIEHDYVGFVARIFQHEIDHLNGIIFIDHIDNPDHLHWVEKEDYPQYRLQYQAWPHKFAKDGWEKMKAKK